MENSSISNEMKFQKIISDMNEMVEAGKDKDIHDTNKLAKKYNKNVAKMMSEAKKDLVSKKIVDIKNYEKALYALLSQYKDLYDQYETDAMMDIADLYILQGESRKGNNLYEYILRENKQNASIFVRYASIYVTYDEDVARNIAKRASHVIEPEGENYKKIISILEG